MDAWILLKLLAIYLGDLSCGDGELDDPARSSLAFIAARTEAFLLNSIIPVHVQRSCARASRGGNVARASPAGHRHLQAVAKASEFQSGTNCTGGLLRIEPAEKLSSESSEHGR
jgi:hypothetical protein